MKKIFLLLGVALVIAVSSCKSSTESTVNTDSTTIDSVKVDTTVVDTTKTDTTTLDTTVKK